jgi:hypothetical protein
MLAYAGGITFIFSAFPRGMARADEWKKANFKHSLIAP